MYSKYLVLFVLILTSCSVNKEKTKKESPLENSCPKEGICELEILKNKSLVIKNVSESEFLYEIIDDKDKSVVVYQYKKDIDQTQYDGGYREEIVFEISNKDENETLSGEELQNKKMLFGRHCHCRGQAGTFKINDGKLDLNVKSGKVNFNLDFTISAVPQIIKSIKVENGKLK